MKTNHSMKFSICMYCFRSTATWYISYRTSKVVNRVKTMKQKISPAFKEPVRNKISNVTIFPKTDENS